jgi:hypothetical protein
LTARIHFLSQDIFAKTTSDLLTAVVAGTMVYLLLTELPLLPANTAAVILQFIT